MIISCFDVICDDTTLHAELTKPFGIIEHISPVSIATLLDSRFKNLHFNNSVVYSNAMVDLKKL